jgi:hypothetical protein
LKSEKVNQEMTGRVAFEDDIKMEELDCVLTKGKAAP